jgi:hypothetical protein
LTRTRSPEIRSVPPMIVCVTELPSTSIVASASARAKPPASASACGAVDLRGCLHTTSPSAEVPSMIVCVCAA